MQTINLDLSVKSIVPILYAKQNEVGRKLEIVLTDFGLPYIPEEGSVFSVWYSGASGEGNYTDIGDRPAFSVSGNKVTVELIFQMLQNAGEGLFCLVLSRAGGEQIGLWNIRYICEGVPGAGSKAAKEYYTAFSKAIENIPYPDESLSVRGKSADAAAVGSLTINGKSIKGNPVLAAVDVGARADNWLPTTEEIGAVPAHESETYPDCFYRTVGEEIEWLNPPMLVALEYRTTERYNGKPVYVKRINFGTMPNNELSSISVVSSKVNVISISGVANSSSETNAFPVVLNGQIGAYAYASTSNTATTLSIRATTDTSAYTAEFIIKYTKD